MYAPAGFGYPEVGDVEVFPDRDRLHLFHLTLPNHDAVRHAISDDGLSWRPLPDALRTSDPGACDDDMIWTMSVTKRDSDYVMVYTALSAAESGRVQRTAVATSDDLVTWRKSAANPVAQADPRWYEAELEGAAWVSWRDPKPVLVGDMYYAVVCARERGGPPLRRGCAGLMASRDLERWEVRPPLFAPRAYWDLECPQVFFVDGQPYLTAAIMEDRSQRYWMAPRFEGPYEVPPDGGVLAPHGHYAGRVCRWRDEDLYFCWHKADYDWPGIRNAAGKFVVAPLALFRRPDGSLGRRSFSGWRLSLAAPPEPPARQERTLLHEASVAEGGAWRVDAPGRLDVAATAGEAGDVWVEGEIALDAPIGGLALRLDPQGTGYFITLHAGSPAVTLTKWLPGQAPAGGRAWFRYVELQRGELRAPLARGHAVPFRLIVSGQYVECSLDGEVVLATLSAERLRGHVGVWADSGSVAAREFRSAPLRPLRHG